MKRQKIIILGEEDLRIDLDSKEFEDINISDLLCDTRTIHSESVILYIDSKCRTKVLKNRYGNRGVVSNID